MRTAIVAGFAVLLLAALLLWGSARVVLRGAGPAVLPPPSDIAEAVNETGLPLRLPSGFSMTVAARDLPGARVVAADRAGNLWVSQTSLGTVTALQVRDGEVRNRRVVFSGLRRPHGIAFSPDGRTVFIAEEHRIARASLAPLSAPQTVYALPPAGRHFTRTLGFGPGGRLYVSIGSTCDVCIEEDERNGAILSMEPDGSGVRFAARGLRNAVFFTRGPEGKLWATEMGRDQLGDDVPPDEVNVIEEGGHYGWPWCYGNGVRDGTFRPRDTFDCAQTIPPRIALQAHAAPLGLAFVPGGGWPSDWRGDLLVALHGSWNRSAPVGYSVVRVPLDGAGAQEGPPQEFIAGWLTGEGALGRPVDLLFAGGALYVTDDKAGVLYRVAHTVL